MRRRSEVNVCGKAYRVTNISTPRTRQGTGSYTTVDAFLSRILSSFEFRVRSNQIATHDSLLGPYRILRAGNTATRLQHFDLGQPWQQPTKHSATSCNSLLSHLAHYSSMAQSHDYLTAGSPHEHSIATRPSVCPTTTLQLRKS